MRSANALPKIWARAFERKKGRVRVTADSEDKSYSSSASVNSLAGIQRAWKHLQKKTDRTQDDRDGPILTRAKHDSLPREWSVDKDRRRGGSIGDVALEGRGELLDGRAGVQVVARVVMHETIVKFSLLPERWRTAM